MNEPKKRLHHHLSDYFFPHPRNDYRPHLFSRTSVTAIALVVLACEAGYVAQTKVVFFTTDFLAAVLPSVLADLTNVARAENGLTLVTPNPVLDAAAQAAAEDMATNSYFAHVSPDGKTPWHWLDKAGYAYSYAGQNLAVNFTDSENVQTAWLQSPTHRANIMKPQYTQVGFGTANGVYQGHETTFVVEFFATPAVVAVSAPAKPIAVAKKPTPVPAIATSSVLGTEVKQAIPAADIEAPATATPEASPNIHTPSTFKSERLASFLASPQNTLETTLTTLLVIVASAFGFTVVMRSKMQHPSVVYGGAFLFLFISAALLGSVVLGGSVILPTDTEIAGVVVAL